MYYGKNTYKIYSLLNVGDEVMGRLLIGTLLISYFVTGEKL